MAISNKRLKRLLTTGLLVFAVGFSSVIMAQNFTVNDGTGTVGGTASTTVDFTDVAPTGNVAAFSFDITYDTDQIVAFDIVACSASDNFAGVTDHELSCSVPVAGRIRLDVVSGSFSALPSSPAFATLTFNTVTDLPAVLTIDPASFLIVDRFNYPVAPGTLTNGQITESITNCTLSTTAFPDTVVNTNVTRTIQLTNTSQTTLTNITPALATGTHFAIMANACNTPLAPDANCDISVTFSPVAAIVYNDTLNVTGSATCSTALTGNGVLAPTAVITSTVPNAAEPNINGEFVVTLSAAQAASVNVNYALDPTSTVIAGNDYQPLSGTVVIPANNLSATIPIVVIDDDINEDAETVILNLATGTGYEIGSPNSATVSIADNDSTPAATDLSVTLEAIPDPLAVDGNVEYVQTVTNQGPERADNVQLIFTYNDILDFTGQFRDPNWACSGAPSPITCQLDGGLANGVSTELGLRFTATQAGQINASTTVSSDADDPDTTNNQATANTPVVDTTAGISVNPVSALQTTEAGGTASFTVVLTQRPPIANVTIDLTSDNPNEGTITVGSLIFTPINWDDFQTVVITGVGDQVSDGNIDYTINTAPAVSNDPAYNGINPADVSVTNIDTTPNNPDIIISSISNPTSEDGTDAVFSISITGRPTADVIINIRSDNPQEGTVNPSQSVYTPDDWFQSQQITVIGQDDELPDGDTEYLIITESAISDDPRYDGRNPADLVVTNIDDEPSDNIFTGEFE